MVNLMFSPTHNLIESYVIYTEYTILVEVGDTPNSKSSWTPPALKLKGKQNPKLKIKEKSNAVIMENEQNPERKIREKRNVIMENPKLNVE